MITPPSERQPRSVSVLRNSIIYPTLPYQLEYTLAYIDEPGIKLSELFAEEERLAALIADNDLNSDRQYVPKFVSRRTIEQVILMAIQIADIGQHTVLATSDEVISAIHLYELKNPKTRSKNAQTMLDHYVSGLKDKNLASVARLMAILAYYSVDSSASN